MLKIILTLITIYESVIRTTVVGL